MIDLFWASSLFCKKPIVITNHHGKNLTDYQIKLLINTTKEVDSGRMQPDCSDMRFINSKGENLNYWIKNPSSCNDSSTYTIVWVKVNLSKNSNTYIYMTYGSPNAKSMSNGSNVFIDFDDFDHETEGSNPKNWMEYSDGGNGVIKIDHSQYVSYPNSLHYHRYNSYGDWWAIKDINDISLSNNYIVEWDAKIKNINRIFMYGHNTHPITWGYRWGPRILFEDDGYIKSAGTLADFTSLQPYSSMKWYHFKIYNINFKSKTYSLEIDRADDWNNLKMGPNVTNIGAWCILGKRYNDTEMWLDNFIIRKQVYPQPTYNVLSDATCVNVECYSDDDCTRDKKCVNHKCVKILTVSVSHNKTISYNPDKNHSEKDSNTSQYNEPEKVTCCGFPIMIILLLSLFVFYFSPKKT